MTRYRYTYSYIVIVTIAALILQVIVAGTTNPMLLILLGGLMGLPLFLRSQPTTRNPVPGGMIEEIDRVLRNKKPWEPYESFLTNPSLEWIDGKCQTCGTDDLVMQPFIKRENFQGGGNCFWCQELSNLTHHLKTRNR